MYHTTSEALADRCSRSKTSPPHLKKRTPRHFSFLHHPKVELSCGEGCDSLQCADNDLQSFLVFLFAYLSMCLSRVREANDTDSFVGRKVLS